MTAFDSFQTATVFISEGQRVAARRELIRAIAWIDRTGQDRDMRDSLANLMDALALARIEADCD